MKALFSAAAGILLFSLAAFAGENTFSLLILQILVCLNFAAAFPRLWNPEPATKRALSASSGAIICAGLFLIWSSVQIWTPAFLKPFGVGSVDGGRSFDFLAQFVIYILFFYAQLPWCGHRSPMRSLEIVMLAAAVTAGVLGMFQGPAGEGYLWTAYFPRGSDPFGPFYNNDDFGAWVAVLFPLILAGLDYRHTLSLREITEKESRENAKITLFRTLVIYMKSGVILYAAAALFLPAACFVARARSALAVLLLLTFFYALVRMADPAKRKSAAVLIAAILGSVILYGSTLLFHEYTAASLAASLAQRLDFARQNLNLALIYAPFGSGLGTYRQIAAQGVTYFRDGVLPPHGYHEWIEWFSDSGWPGLVFAAAGVVLFFLHCIRNGAGHVSEWRRVMALQAAISLAGILLLSQISFHLKIPAIAFLVFFQAAAACALSGHLKPAGDSQRAANRFTLRHMLLIFLSVLAFFCACNAGARLYTEIRIKTDPSIIVLQKAVHRHPGQAVYRHLLAAELEKMYDEKTGDKKMLAQAAAEMREAVLLSPDYGYYAFYLATLLEKLGEDADALLMYEQSINLAPYEFRHYFQMLRFLMKMSIQAADPAEKAAFFLKARDLDKKMRSLRYAPSETRIRQGMGPKAYIALKKFESAWQN